VSTDHHSFDVMLAHEGRIGIFTIGLPAGRNSQLRADAMGLCLTICDGHGVLGGPSDHLSGALFNHISQRTDDICLDQSLDRFIRCGLQCHINAKHTVLEQPVSVREIVASDHNFGFHEDGG
jgi:hypothetical protein